MKILKPSPIYFAIRKFLKTTTLHGFKYLCSEFYVDRIGWLLCCCVSACCAGLLCTVLWARFKEVPALLALYDLKLEMAEHQLPLVAVCPSVESIADKFIHKLSSDKNLTRRLPITLARVLDGKPTAEDQLQVIDDLLTKNNVSLLDIMMEHMPPCHEVIKKCRWQDVNKPCSLLFDVDVTDWGICCVMKPNERLINHDGKMQLRNGFRSTLRLDLVMQSSNSRHNNFEFFPKYDGEEWVEPITLTPGYSYLAQLRYKSIPESTDTEALVEEACISQPGYSRRDCFDRCTEKICGCVDPLRGNQTEMIGDLLPCSMTDLKCLRTYGIKDVKSCNCPPTCKKVTTDITLESSLMNFDNYIIDPLYSGLNTTSAVVMHFRVNINLSRIFTLYPTETWFTLLSSLGGVFNMFLGVGLFSALELLYLIFIKLPSAIRKSSKVNFIK